MAEWPFATLAEACSDGGLIQTGPFGSQLHKADYRPAGIPVIMPTNIRDGRVVEDGIAYIDPADAHRLARHRTEVGDIVFSRRGEVDKCAVITARERGWLCGTGCLLARPNSRKANPYFLGYSIGTPGSKSWLRQHAVGATMPNLNTGILQRLPVPWPEKAVQDEVAGILQSLDNKIELNRRMNETLEAQARALFRDWFVDFGPVKAKMAGDAPYLAPDLWSLFPDRLDDDGLPQGWSEVAIGDVADLRGGKQLPKTEIAARGPVPVFGGAGIMGYTENGNADGYVITVGRVGAYCGQFFAHRGSAWVNNNASLIKPKEGTSPEWLFLAIRELDIESIKKGAAQPFVSNGDIAELRLVQPLSAVMEAFLGLVMPLILRQEANQSETALLVQTRDLLLPKLMSGEIRVGEAAKELEGA